MMTVRAELLGLVEAVAEQVELPPINWVYIPEPDPGPGRHTEFGIVTLRDGSAGLYYAWLGDSQKGMGSRYEPGEFSGRHPLELARYCAGTDEADCSLGMAAVNAITRYVFRQADFTPVDAQDSMGILDIAASDHVGMVGYFPSLVKRLRNNGIRLTVIEKKSQFHKAQENFLVSADMQTLDGCNKVMITASTLLNNSIDEVLEYSHGAQKKVIIGPTAGFFPDPLFARGISAIGGSEIRSAQQARQRLSTKQGLGESARKFLISAQDYPGLEQIMQEIKGSE
ncbi:MAG: DUF364 domain-containing protein [Gammaproteobacteria bacterium]|nr:DUF364 domain-containing protein [Gammaproteobacteria bacterium]